MEVQVRFCDVVEVSEGKIALVRSYFDSVTLLRQLGIIGSTPLHAPDRRAALDLYAQPLESNPQRNKAIVQRFVQDVFNRQDPKAAADTCSVAFEWHGGSLGETRGLTAYQHVLSALFLAFPDLQIDVLDCVGDGDRVMMRFGMRGTHLGEFQGVAPTFRSVSGGGTSTYRLENGRIVEEWWQGDILVLLQQMDAAPSTVPLSS
jgi:predicted ester cyclase